MGNPRYGVEMRVLAAAGLLLLLACSCVNELDAFIQQPVVPVSKNLLQACNQSSGEHAMGFCPMVFFGVFCIVSMRWLVLAFWMTGAVNVQGNVLIANAGIRRGLRSNPYQTTPSLARHSQAVRIL